MDGDGEAGRSKLARASATKGASIAAQELQISAIYQRERLLDQAIGPFAGCRILEFDGGQFGLLRPENLGGDVAGLAARCVEIGGPQELDIMMPLKIGEPQLGRQQANPLTEQKADESRREIETQLVDAVGRDEHGRLLDRVFIQQPDMNFTRAIADDQLSAIAVRALGENRPHGRGIEGDAQMEAGRSRGED